MCLIVFAYKAHPKYKLILAANRDEFYERPTAVANWWEDHTSILAGRDLKAQGTWMGVDKNGRFAAVTNYRDASNVKENVKSRGDLPVNFLAKNKVSIEYNAEVLEEADQYTGFNLLTMDKDMVCINNYENKINVLESGIYGLSNALLDVVWPKVEKAKNNFQIIINGNFSPNNLIELMQDEEVVCDEKLPQTGLPLETERAVSAMCIRTSNYGTCCSTIITIDYNGNVLFREQSYPVGNRSAGVVSYSFKVEK